MAKLSSSDFFESFAKVLSRLLRADVVVKHLWKMAFEEEKEEFPRHFYNLCSTSKLTQSLGFRSLVSSSFHLNLALDYYCSFFFHIKCHSYLHSSIGTFSVLTEQSITNSSSSSSSSSSSPLSHSPEQLQQLLEQLLDIIFFSSFEVIETIAPVFQDLFNSAKITTPQDKTDFFLQLYISSFLCSCLEQPQVVLSLPLSSDSIALCSFFASILRRAVTLPSSSSPLTNKELFVQQLSLIARQKLEKLSECILWLEEGKMEEGYRQFFCPLWEKYHHSCHRDGNRATCSMKEPTLVDSYKYFEDFLKEKKGELDKVAGGAKMEGWSTEGEEAVRELVKWMDDEKREQLELSFTPSRSSSPVYME